MSTLKHRSFLLAILLFRFALIVVVSSIYDGCSNSRCTGMAINYPFRISDQPATCGLPGFDLLCGISSGSYPTLYFPSSGQTFSADIIYPTSYNLISLTDPQGCLQEKLLGFDSSGTPFHFLNQTNFPIYNCTRSDKMPSSYRDTEISCLSGLTYSVLWDRYGVLNSTTYGCVFIGVAKGPGDWAYNISHFSSAKSVEMGWELPVDCQRCNYGQSCQRDPNDLTKVMCSGSSPPPRALHISSQTSADHTNYNVVIPVFFGMFGPIFLGILCAVCIAIRKRTGNRNRTRSATRNFTDINNITMVQNRPNTNRQPPSIASGLEQGTLDTYPTIVVGESGRMLANMEDKNCPICLSDFEPNETLKTLPECLHKFHAECIDKWLREKALCPVCRTPPPRRSS